MSAHQLSAENDASVVDAIIVGAGLSGLASANRLVAAGKSVVVLEARDRVGGKVYDKTLSGGGVIETGAEFIGPCQDRVRQIAIELGIKTFKTYASGQNVCYANGKRNFYDPQTGNHAPLDEAALIQMASTVGSLDTMAQGLDVTAPWKHHDAAVWDQMTLASWLDKSIPHPDGRAVMDLTARSLLSAEPSDVSLLQALTYIARAGSENTQGTLQRLISVEGGSQENRFTGGPQRIARGLADRLGEAVKLNSPVRTITRVHDVYHVSGETVSVRGRSVVLALSPPLAGRITYNPPLPASRDLLTQKMPMGSLGKVIAIYKTPFWRDEGLSGEAIGLHGVSVQTTFDSSPEDGSHGAILGFLVGNAMRQFDGKTESEIQAAVVEDFVKYFGPKAREVEEWVIQRWDNEEFSRGGHFAICPPNVLTQYGPAITEQVGGIFFAGTEAAPYWSGFMEGAIRAGEIAADKICQQER
ncbi:amine oxidase [Cadophora sp. DSE1049]|nr:amine oxidase [Cadophora sp. DSE1049]